MVSSSSSCAPVGKSLGKVTGFLSFAEVVPSPSTVLDGGALVQTAAVVWSEVENIIPLGRELETIRQAMDCFALERSSFGRLGKDFMLMAPGFEIPEGVVWHAPRRGLQWMTLRLKLTHQCRSWGF
jgi:hypothetical protein